MMRSGKRLRVASTVAAAAAALLLPTMLAAQDTGSGGDGVTFFTGPNFTGSSKTLTLAPDQPYVAIPYVGDELNEKIASLRSDAGIGVILFQRPYFASRDDACGTSLGTFDNPDAWWTGRTADFVPPVPTDQPHAAAELPDDDYSSVIAYRRELGPPPAFLLLERRSYYNRGCERSSEQAYFNRLVVPVPNPPQREACVDLAQPASAPGAGSDAPAFVRISEAFALLPQAAGGSYPASDHRFLLTLFDGAGCSGSSIALTSNLNGRPGAYRLSSYDFDRRVRSVSIRYQRGPLDRHLIDAPDTEAVAAPTLPQPPLQATPLQAAPQTATQPAPQTAPQPSQTVPERAAPQAAPRSAPEPAPAVAAPAADGGLQPPPPSAPPQQSLQPAPQPQLAPAPVPAPAPAPARPTGPQEETYRFPVHQVYRLNYCLDGEQGCGEPAATAWCKVQGFDRAARWTLEDNIGALYPTVFIGSGNLCDKFLCDGFEEITCTR